MGSGRFRADKSVRKHGGALVEGGGESAKNDDMKEKARQTLNGYGRGEVLACWAHALLTLGIGDKALASEAIPAVKNLVSRYAYLTKIAAYHNYQSGEGLHVKMPGRRAADVAIDKSLCRRCQEASPVITVRTEPLCEACFSKYVTTKIIKRMESFRVRHSDPGRERTLLLPLSFGVSSTTLLHILSQHLKGQAEKTGRTGFKLHVLHVYETEGALDAISSSMLDKVRDCYPDCSYSTCPLADVLSLSGVSELLSLSSADGDNSDSLTTLISGLPSASSRADIHQILLRKLIQNRAEEQGCEAILWADSTTRLAERTLAETAKGRGASLPWIVADGEAPFHGVPYYFPMRDLLSKEVAAFARMISPPLYDLILQKTIKPAVSTKNTTIDDLMTQYFESVEREYPSIVANVVKTSSKLRAPPLSDVEAHCELCSMPLTTTHAPERSRLCYGCIRTLSLPSTT